MDLSVAERIAIVETKVEVLEGVGPKIDMIYDYVMAEKAQKSLVRNGLIAVGGFVAFLGTIWEITNSLPHR